MELDIIKLEKLISENTEGVPISKVLSTYGVPCTNKNKLTLISMLKFHPTLTTNFQGETFIVKRFS
ncbi:hypothetical protein [Enterococcus avium]|uniref:hypothetical protein n=1 Tax=Enterococcus avium TaxID=33945 RepID=UPI001F55B2F9|nr:hypothetical protein [Enterococcus avium]